MSGKLLLRGVVTVVLICGLMSLLAGLGRLIASGAVTGQIAIGLMYIGLAIWLYRGSNVARIILAALFAFGIVLACVFGFFVTYQDKTATIVWLTLVLISTPVLWTQVLSTSLRAELAANAEKYRKPDPQREKE
jgi:hypothetical protein